MVNRAVSCLANARGIASAFALCAASFAGTSAHASDIQEEAAPAENPGQLRLFSYVPEDVGPGAAMVVVLHGCGQSADEYVTLSGWQTVADDYEFLLVAPQQEASNNFTRCFNWFSPGDHSRGAGEAHSIAQMVAAVAERESVDPARIFVTGLSAGGFMTSAMLALYPDVFAGGAPVAGGPYGCAQTALGASTCMNGFVSKSAEAWADEARSVMPSGAALPRISIWHGEEDLTVSPKTSEDINLQWTTLHDLSEAEARVDDIAGHRRTRYGEPVVVEHIALAGIGHAVPVAPSVCGAVGSYAEDAGVCAALEIARFWGLTEAEPEPHDAGPLPDVDAAAVPGSDAGPEAAPEDTGGCSTSGPSQFWLALIFAALLMRQSGRVRERNPLNYQ